MDKFVTKSSYVDSIADGKKRRYWLLKLQEDIKRSFRRNKECTCEDPLYCERLQFSLGNPKYVLALRIQYDVNEILHSYRASRFLWCSSAQESLHRNVNNSIRNHTPTEGCNSYRLLYNTIIEQNN